MPRAARSPIFILWRDASLVLLSWLLVTPALWADDYQLGQAAYELGDYEQTVQLWRPLAEAGDVRAQFGLGTLYFEGHGVTSDLEQSARWFRKAAEQGFAPAQFNLGNAYKHGRGVARDDRLASAWWRHAAEQEFAPAQFNLGTKYYFGRGVEKNEQEALRGIDVPPTTDIRGRWSFSRHRKPGLMRLPPARTPTGSKLSSRMNLPFNYCYPQRSVGP